MPLKTAPKRNITVNLPDAHPGQVEAWRRRKRFNIMRCGRRWRKTTYVMRGMVMDAFSQPSSSFLWTAPVYTNVRIGMEEMMRACGHVVNFTESRMEADFPNGSKIYFRSLEKADNARGYTAGKVAIDEAAFCEPEAYHGVLRPMVMDTGGEIDFIFTPNGLNWMYDLEQMALADIQKNGESSEWSVFHAPSLGVEIEDGKLVRKPHPFENPHIPFSEVQEMYRTMPERMFRQEIMAEYISDAGNVFARVDRAIRWGERDNEPPNARYSYQMGVDIARSHDFTVITIVRKHDLRQVYWERFNQISWERIYNRIAEAARKYNALCVLDATGSAGDAQSEELRRRGVSVIPYKLTQQSKTDLIDHLAARIEHHPDPFLLDIPQQTNELKVFEYQNTPSGQIRMRAPAGEGYFDDCVIALALACYRLRGKETYSSASESFVPIVSQISDTVSIFDF